MTENQKSTSLFDSREIWLTEPLIAIDGLLKSDDYLLTGKPRAYAGAPALDGEKRVTKLSDGSITVYRAMLGKFLAALVEQGCPSLLEASAQHIGTFFDGPAMADAKKETVNRYRRLLERVFDYLVARGYIEFNPVNTWLAGFKEQHDNQKPEDTKESSKPDVVDQQTVLRLREWLKGLGDQALKAGDWRTLRNVVAAMLSVGAGLRATELQLLKRSQFTMRWSAPEGQRIEITVPNNATVRTAQAHRVMVDRLAEDLVKAWFHQRFVAGVKPTPSAEAKVLPGDRLFIGVGREQGKSAAGWSDQLSVSYFNRALKKFAQQAIKEHVIGQDHRWLLCRGAQGLRRAYALAEIQTDAKPSDLRLKLGLHLEASVKKYEHQFRARARVPRVKV